MAKLTPSKKAGIFRELNDRGLPWSDCRFVLRDGEYVLLGSGAFSEVYLLESREDPDKTFAVKVIGFHENRRIHDSDIKSYKREPVLQKGVSTRCKYVVDAFPSEVLSIRLDDEGRLVEARKDASGADQNGWLVLVLLKMERLSPIIEQNLTGDYVLCADPLKTYDAGSVLKLAIHIAEALQTAHGLGLMHRDVKLENIFYDEKNDLYKLGDFGIARITNQGSASTKGAGTLGYEAPEVEGGNDAGYSYRADIYSFGIMLYLLMNRLRFPGSGSVYYVNRSVQYSPAATIAAPEFGPEELQDLVCECIRYNPEERPGDMQEVLEQLKDIYQFHFGDDAVCWEEPMPRGALGARKPPVGSFVVQEPAAGSLEIQTPPAEESARYDSLKGQGEAEKPGEVQEPAAGSLEIQTPPAEESARYDSLEGQGEAEKPGEVQEPAAGSLAAQEPAPGSFEVEGPLPGSFEVPTDDIAEIGGRVVARVTDGADQGLGGESSSPKAEKEHDIGGKEERPSERPGKKSSQGVWVAGGIGILLVLLGLFHFEVLSRQGLKPALGLRAFWLCIAAHAAVAVLSLLRKKRLERWAAVLLLGVFIYLGWGRYMGWLYWLLTCTLLLGSAVDHVVYALAGGLAYVAASPLLDGSSGFWYDHRLTWLFFAALLLGVFLKAQLDPKEGSRNSLLSYGVAAFLTGILMIFAGIVIWVCDKIPAVTVPELLMDMHFIYVGLLVVVYSLPKIVMEGRG